MKAWGPGQEPCPPYGRTTGRTHSSAAGRHRVWKNKTKKDILFKLIAKQSSINIRWSVRGVNAIFRKYMSNTDPKVHSMWLVVGVRNYVLFKNKKTRSGGKKRGKMKFYTLFTLRMYEIPSITVVLFIRIIVILILYTKKFEETIRRQYAARKQTINL